MTANSPTYDRFGGFGIYYYEAIMISVPKTGFYGVTCNSSIDTYGYLYLNSFNPLNMAENLITGDDDKGEDYQFLLQHIFRSTDTYILVVTTHDQLVIGPFSVFAGGLENVTFTSINITTTTATQSLSTITLTSCEFSLLNRDIFLKSGKQFLKTFSYSIIL